MGHAFMQTPADVESPVHAFRTAQVKGLGGSDSLGFQACRSILGAMLGSIEQEEFTQSMLLWMADREEELSQVHVDNRPFILPFCVSQFARILGETRAIFVVQR